MNPIDVIVGRNVREKRTLKGISQEALGLSVGVAFQQIQKYENATNRISASRLVEIARVLMIPVQDLFDGVAEEIGEQEKRTAADMRREHQIGEQAARLPVDVQKAVQGLVRAIIISLGGAYTEGL